VRKKAAPAKHKLALIGYATKVYGKEPRSTWAPFSGATLLQTFIFIQRYVKIVLLEWHEHTHTFFEQGQIEILRQTHRTNYFHPPSASLGRALFIHEAMHHTGAATPRKVTLPHSGKNVFARANIENNNSGHQRVQSQTPIAGCMSIVISNEKFPSEMLCGVRPRTPPGLV
jgi:hypothetical protein